MQKQLSDKDKMLLKCIRKKSKMIKYIYFADKKRLGTPGVKDRILMKDD